MLPATIGCWANGAEGGSRTRTDSHPRDFKSLESTIPPPRHVKHHIETRRGLAPLYSAFAERCLATWLPGLILIIPFLISLFYFSFLIFLKSSSTLPASAVLFSLTNEILGTGLIFNFLFNFCWREKIF